MPRLKTIVDYTPQIYEEQQRLISEGAEPIRALKQAILMYEDYLRKGVKEVD